MRYRSRYASISLPSSMCYCVDCSSWLVCHIDELCRDKTSKVFREPVDWKALNLLDYPIHVKHPMDLHTIRTKLSSGAYKNKEEFANDVYLVWDNSARYNGPENKVTKTAAGLHKKFELWLTQALNGQTPVYISHLIIFTWCFIHWRV